MRQSRAAYFGIDNMEEVEVLFTAKQRREITKVAKSAKIPEVELLGRYIEQISLAGLAGVAAGMAKHRKEVGRKHTAKVARFGGEWQPQCSCGWTSYLATKKTATIEKNKHVARYC